MPALAPILLVQFIGAFGLSVVLPVLIVVVLDFGGDEVVYGIVSATYPAFQLVGAPWLGRLSDRVGRRRVLLVSQAGTLLAWLLFAGAFFLPQTRLVDVDDGWLGAFALTVPLALVMAARALDGLTGGNVSVATAYLADASTPATRKRNFGWMAAATSTGFIVGPALAGLLAATPVLGRANLLPVLAAAAISAVALAVIGSLLHDVRAPRTDDLPLTLKRAARLPGVPLLLGLYFVIYLGFNFFYVAFPVYATAGMGWSPTRLGIFFSVLSAVLVVVQGPLMSRLGDRVPDRALYTVGGLVLAGGFATMVVLPQNWLYASAVLFGLGNGLMWPSFLSLLATAAGDGYQGAVQGLGSSFGSAAAIIGLLVGGVLYGQLGAGVFALSAGAIALAAVGYWVMPGRAATARE